MIQFLSKDYIDNEELKCSTHRDDPAIGRISGDIDCYYCGNTVNICNECWLELVKDVTMGVIERK